jgi:hypothetical protein
MFAKARTISVLIIKITAHNNLDAVPQEGSLQSATNHSANVEPY